MIGGIGGVAVWGPPLLASFLASLVEFVEALTIVLAVGTVRGWRPALVGTAAGLGALLLLLVILGPLLMQIPISVLQLAIGILLLLFGMRWLRKATLRLAGLIAFHDEALAYDKETRVLSAAPKILGGNDPVAVITAFKGVLLEGLEVAFIVVAVGAAGGHFVPAGIGALAALFLVIAAGLMIHRPLARVPENTLKLCVGAIISAFGIFWVGEGLGFDWPGADIDIVVLAVVLLGLAWGAGELLRTRAAEAVR